MATPPPTSTTPMMTPGKFRRFLLSNMESFLVHTMPLVRLCEKENNTTKKKSKKDFTLKSLWEAFHETSAFGCEVPLEMNANNKERSEKEEDAEENEEPEVIAQYYASYVSAFQIFEKTKKKTLKKKRREERRKNGVGESRSDDCDDDFKEASAQYFESLAPYSRPPLTDVIERLAEENEKVQSLKASEIDREKSWFCFAWYPIYRIPQGTSRSDIQGCFLTYHGLNHLDIEDEEDEEEDGDESEEGEEEEEEKEEVEEEEEEEKVDKDGEGEEEVEHGEKNGKTSRIRGLPPLPPASLTLAGETRLQRRIEDAKKSVAVLEKDERSNTTTTTKGDDVEHTNFIPLKPFGLCCYKTDPEIWEESDEAENARTAAMIDGAYAFLRSLEVIHPDYEFFSHHG